MIAFQLGADERPRNRRLTAMGLSADFELDEGGIVFRHEAYNDGDGHGSATRNSITAGLGREYQVNNSLEQFLVSQGQRGRITQKQLLERL